MAQCHHRRAVALPHPLSSFIFTVFCQSFATVLAETARTFDRLTDIFDKKHQHFAELNRWPSFHFFKLCQSTSPAQPPCTHPLGFKIVAKLRQKMLQNCWKKCEKLWQNCCKIEAKLQIFAGISICSVFLVLCHSKPKAPFCRNRII